MFFFYFTSKFICKLSQQLDVGRPKTGILPCGLRMLGEDGHRDAGFGSTSRVYVYISYTKNYKIKIIPEENETEERSFVYFSNQRRAHYLELAGSRNSNNLVGNYVS
jgi:hypothetical protein